MYVKDNLVPKLHSGEWTMKFWTILLVSVVTTCVLTEKVNYAGYTGEFSTYQVVYLAHTMVYLT